MKINTNLLAQPVPRRFQAHRASPKDVFTPSPALSPELLLQKAWQGSRAEQGRQVEELVSTFPGRDGYDVNFLGRPLPLPKLSPELQAKVAPLLSNPNESELEYTNFSIVMNKERRQPFFTAVNIDGAKIVDVPRDGKWTIDGRIAREHQLGNEAYRGNPIDRGHQVRRRDPAWGADAHQASNDTFAYTNAALQHGSLNQKTWLDLENHVLNTARSTGMKMTVLTGPVLKDSDPAFDNNGKVKPATQMPQEFWKVVVWNDPKEGLKGSAFVLSQSDYVERGGLYKSEFEPGRFSVYQVPLEKLEETTGLEFGPVSNTQPASQRIQTPGDALLPG